MYFTFVNKTKPAIVGTQMVGNKKNIHLRPLLPCDCEDSVVPNIWVFPKIMVPPNNPFQYILIGLSIIFTNPFWGKPPWLVVSTHLKNY